MIGIESNRQGKNEGYERIGNDLKHTDGVAGQSQGDPSIGLHQISCHLERLGGTKSQPGERLRWERKEKLLEARKGAVLHRGEPRSPADPHRDFLGLL